MGTCLLESSFVILFVKAELLAEHKVFVEEFSAQVSQLSACTSPTVKRIHDSASPGAFEISYTPLQSGVYYIQIMVNSSPIKVYPLLSLVL